MNKLNLTNPLNTKHPLTKGLLNAYFGLPQWMDGRTWFDLKRVSNGVLANGFFLGTSSGPRPSYRPNAIKEMRLDVTGDLIVLNKTIAHGFGDFTFGIWFRANDFAATRVLQGYSGDVGNTFIGHLGSTTTISARDSGVYVFNWTVPTMSANVWYHLVITRISAQARCYLNGVQSSTGAISSTGTFSTDIIGYTYQPNFSWNGAVDAITIYGRGLSAGEVRSLYKETQRGCPKLFNRVTPARVCTTGIQTPTPTITAPKPVKLNITHPVNKKHPLAIGLKAWWLALPQWAGGATWFDLCRRYNVTLDNTVRWQASYRPGNNRCLNFSTSSGSIGNMGTFSKVTIAMWVRLDVTHGWSISTSLAKGILLDNAQFRYLGFGVDYSTFPTISGGWQNIVVTADSVNVNLYMNGVFLGSTAQTNSTETFSTVTLGNKGDGSESFVGLMDDVRIYDRALGSGEVATLYTNSKEKYKGLLKRVNNFGRIQNSSNVITYAPSLFFSYL